MTCVHLRQLYKLCEENDIKLSGSDLIRVACTQCGEQEVCPSTLTDEYDAKVADQLADHDAAIAPESKTAGSDQTTD